MNLSTYLKEVASWGRVRPEDASHASFLGNAIDSGQSMYQAAIGWALTQKAADNARSPSKHSFHRGVRTTRKGTIRFTPKKQARRG